MMMRLLQTILVGELVSEIIYFVSLKSMIHSPRKNYIITVYKANAFLGSNGMTLKIFFYRPV